jgi:hypothetical protein
MTTSLEPVKSDRKEASEFLSGLFGHYFQDSDGWVELRSVPPKDKPGPTGRAWCRQGKLDPEAWAEVKRQNQKANIFIGVNPRLIQKGSAVDIESIVCLWVDVDSKEEGGKEGALNRIRDFPIQPSVLVDSGHGYHCYWLLRRPLLQLTEDMRSEVRQILSGLITALKADKARTDLSSCLRLPGTTNLKPGMEPIRCTVVYCHPDVTFTLADFAAYRDTSFREPEGSADELPVFGEREVIVSSESEVKAFEAADLLLIPKRTRDMILLGKVAKNLKDPSDSGRDQSIICSLILAGYGYATIKSIFFCPWLKCSNRIRGTSEATLKWDVQKALKWCEKFRIEGTPQSRQILEIKKNLYLSEAEKQVKIKEFVVGNLLTSQEALGKGFYEDESGPYYFFHTEDKALIDLDSREFENLLVYRFQLNQYDTREAVRALSAVIMTKGTKVTPYTAHYYDSAKGVLYADDGMNGVYRLDGHEIRLQNNGDEGVFFKQCDMLLSFEFLPEEKVINYFRDEPPADYGPSPDYPLGLSLAKFYSTGSLLNECLISLASFTTLEENNISPEEQKLLLLIYFYTLFFEEIFTEKPVASFIGQLQSGKSFLATTIGKIIFGPDFVQTSWPDSDDSLKTILAEERYVVLDDVKRIPQDMKSTLDSYSTGRPKIGKREPYKKTLQKGVPRCFFAITAIEMKGWDDSFMRRVLLFNTKGLSKVTEPDLMWRPLREKRNHIMTEVLVNLNSVVAMLKMYADYSTENPSTITATWSSFGQKVTSWFGSRQLFRSTLLKLVNKKQDVLLDDDPIWWVLHYCLFERRMEPGDEGGGQDIEPMTTQALHTFLLTVAEAMKLREFQNQYKDAISLGRKLVAVKDELLQRISVTQLKGSNNLKLWGFSRKEEVGAGESGTVNDQRKDAEKWERIAKLTERGPELIPAGTEPGDEKTMEQWLEWMEKNQKKEE